MITRIIIATLTLVTGILGLIFGTKQSTKRKIAEEKVEKLTTEIETKKNQVEVANINDAAHVDDIGLVVSSEKEELVTRANNLFGTKTVGKILRDARCKKSLSLLDVSKKTAYTTAELNGFEKDNGLTRDVIEKLSRVYGFTKEEKKDLLEKLEDKK